MVRLPDFPGFRNFTVGGQKRLGPLNGADNVMVLDDIAIAVEILSIRSDGIVFLVGVRNFYLPTPY